MGFIDIITITVLQHGKYERFAMFTLVFSMSSLNMG